MRPALLSFTSCADEGASSTGHLGSLSPSARGEQKRLRLTLPCPALPMLTPVYKRAAVRASIRARSAAAHAPWSEEAAGCHPPHPANTKAKHPKHACLERTCGPGRSR